MTPVNTFHRYIWLIDLLNKRGSLTKEQIDREWASSHLNETHDDEIPRRTFIRMRDAIAELFDIEIACSKKDGNRYFIDFDGAGQNSARRYMLQLFSVSNLLHNTSKIRSRIVLEDVPAASNQFLQVIVEALTDNRILQITYQNFTMRQAYTFDVQPFCLRYYQQRWYLLSKRTDNGNLRLYALDRMQSAQITDQFFSLPEGFDAYDYFSRYVGAMPEDKPVEQVIIRANEFRINYLRSLPLHHSQRETAEGQFEFTIVPTADFIQELRAMGADIVVLKPKWLAEQMKEDAKKVLDAYKKPKS